MTAARLYGFPSKFAAISRTLVRLALALALALAFGFPALAGSVQGVRLGENGDRTRLVLDIDENVAFSYFLLDKPYRVVVDLPELAWDLDGGMGDGRGIIDDYRFGAFRAGTSRLVLDLKAPADVERIFLLPPQSGYPYRLVIDLKPVSQAAYQAAVAAGGATAASANAAIAAPRPSKPAPGKRTIVIDAGHGGVDPGAMSVLGVPEKKITLEVADTLKRELEKSGDYRVLMTRTGDVFVPLEGRVAFSRNAGADLFISIHADAIKNAKIRGATVYTLSQTASDKEAAALARKENKADLIAGVDLQDESTDVAGILLDLAMRETMNHSARFAGLLVPALAKQVSLRDNSHRFAGFVVLKSPDVPSVLLEIGYLSNREDAKAMTSSSGRNSIARAVAEAIDGYFTTVLAGGY
jgi:N-acetylmuramoyl-L-alanine amidase